jgi:ribosomal protein L10
MGMLVSVLYHYLPSRTEKKTTNQRHDSVVSKPTAATYSNMNPGACKLLLKEEQTKNENAVKITFQGKVPAAPLCRRDM